MRLPLLRCLRVKEEKQLLHSDSYFLFFLFFLAARNIFRANCLFNLVKFIVLLNVMVELMLGRTLCIPVNTLTQLFRISPRLIAQQHVPKWDFHLCWTKTNP